MSAAERLVKAIGARDFEAIADCFARDASLRVLTPTQLRDHSGPAEVAARFRRWFGSMKEFELLDADVTQVADRVRIRWHTRGRDPEKGLQENEHTGYAEIVGDRIVALNVSCAGFRPTEGRSA
jgi:ketosteroid isomerase-like protein